MYEAGDKVVGRLCCAATIAPPVRMVALAFRGLLGYDGSSGGLDVGDQARGHGVRLALVYVKKSLGIPLHSSLPSSPDLNPIEIVWGMIKQRIKT